MKPHEPATTATLSASRSPKLRFCSNTGSRARGVHALATRAIRRRSRSHSGLRPGVQELLGEYGFRCHAHASFGPGGGGSRASLAYAQVSTATGSGAILLGWSLGMGCTRLLGDLRMGFALRQCACARYLSPRLRLRQGRSPSRDRAAGGRVSYRRANAPTRDRTEGSNSLAPRPEHACPRPCFQGLKQAAGKQCSGRGAREFDSLGAIASRSIRSTV